MFKRTGLLGISDGVVVLVGQGEGQEEGADIPHFNIRFAGRELPNAHNEIRSAERLPHGLLPFMTKNDKLLEVDLRACQRVHCTIELDSGAAVKTDKTALKPGSMQDARSMLSKGIVNLGRSKAVRFTSTMPLLLHRMLLRVHAASYTNLLRG